MNFQKTYGWFSYGKLLHEILSYQTIKFGTQLTELSRINIKTYNSPGIWVYREEKANKYIVDIITRQSCLVLRKFSLSTAIIKWQSSSEDNNDWEWSPKTAGLRAMLPDIARPAYHVSFVLNDLNPSHWAHFAGISRRSGMLTWHK